MTTAELILRIHNGNREEAIATIQESMKNQIRLAVQGDRPQARMNFVKAQLKVLIELEAAGR